MTGARPSSCHLNIRAGGLGPRFRARADFAVIRSARVARLTLVRVSLMPRFKLHAVVPVLWVLACTERPALTIDNPTESTTGASTTDAATGMSPTGTSPTEAGSTGTDATGTDPSDTTGTSDPTGTTSTTSAETGEATTLDPPPANCAPCDRTWEQDGDIDIWPGMELSQYTCMVKVHGYLRDRRRPVPAELAPLCHLRVVDHWLAIQNNTLLTELSFFSQLKQAHELTLRNLPALGAVAGLTSLRNRPVARNLGDRRDRPRQLRPGLRRHPRPPHP